MRKRIIANKQKVIELEIDEQVALLRSLLRSGRVSSGVPKTNDEQLLYTLMYGIVKKDKNDGTSRVRLMRLITSEGHGATSDGDAINAQKNWVKVYDRVVRDVAAPWGEPKESD
jgi:hypothetical protein